ncbi:MAG: hypothetical protein ACR2QA_16350 [Solirubrobacteraceae bacterium]
MLMLAPGTVDSTGMIHRGLILISFACCALVLASFALFARDQLAGASKHQQNQIVAGVTTTPGVLPSPTHHAQPRRFIDGAASTLDSPFASIVQSDSPWVNHGIPAILALLVYGVGIGYLARYSRGMS